MRIAIGADHAGVRLKDQLAATLRAEGHEVSDAGTFTTDSTDYPDYAEAVSRKVSEGEAERGILVCSSGVGMSIAANKVHGIRAALAYRPEEVELTRRHNDVNVLAIGAKFTQYEEAKEMTAIFLDTPFEGGRHERRVHKIAGIEEAEKQG
jgi:ribose 5-phosphate isomerase B